MTAGDMLAVLLASHDLANEKAKTNKAEWPWKVVEIRRDQYVVRHNESGKKFRVTVKEEP